MRECWDMELILSRIYGGAYTLGSKGVNAAGLIKASQFNNASGVIHVAMNYRLGAFGWLAGPTLQGMGGVSNAGLYDQRLALEWVQKYIHLFGGDPNQVTVMGESAGGGSIMHQITAYGGNKPSPFQRAIIQSPGLTPTVSQFKQENKTQTFLSLLNVSTIEEARQLSSDDLINANSWQVGNASYSDYVWGPVVDGLFVPASLCQPFLEFYFSMVVSPTTLASWWVIIRTRVLHLRHHGPTILLQFELSFLALTCLSSTTS